MLEEMLFGNKQAIESDVLMMNDVSIRREGGRIGDMEDSLEEVQRGDNAVWMDEEEDEIVVDLNSSARLKKLKKSLGGANKVTGRQLTTLLQERYEPCSVLSQNELLYVYISTKLFRDDDNIPKCDTLALWLGLYDKYYRQITRSNKCSYCIYF